MVQRALRLFRMGDAAKPNHLDARGLSVMRPPYAPERAADHLAMCSCFLCTSNNRQHNGPTLRERRAEGDAAAFTSAS